jgi:hypothetical protein
MENTSYDNEIIFDSGLNATQIEDEAKRIREKIYAEAFSKDQPMYYRDRRTDGTKNFIRANPDGSEDLVALNALTREYRLLEQLISPDKGQFAHLTPPIKNSKL